MDNRGSNFNICQGAHRFFVSCDGTVEGTETIKIWIVVTCTVCKESHLIEHIMVKDASRRTVVEL